MSETKWTKDQLSVIKLRDCNILVSAAAGSGKTAVLVERIIEKITNTEKPCDIDKLLVVTFTKAAAAEMRSRIGEAIEKKLEEEPENQHIQKQASLLYSAQITTIDSFCQYIIRNYFHKIDLDPSYKVCDETDAKIMKQKVLEELLEAKYEEGAKDFLEFTNQFSLGRTDKDIEEIILNLHTKAMSYPWPEKWLEQCMHMYDSTSVEELEETSWMKELVIYLRACAEEFLDMAKRARNISLEPNGPTAYQEILEEEVGFFENLVQADSYQEYYDKITGFAFCKLKPVRGKDVDAILKDRAKGLRDAYKEYVEKLREKYFFQTPQEMVEDMQKMAVSVGELIKLTIEFDRVFAECKKEEGVIDFSDMEHFALQILTERGENGEVLPSETALELQNYFEEIMTDEYQDSNEVQEMLLTSLCGKSGEKPYLFMVGDVKQSIYRFRMAKPEIFLEKYKRFKPDEGIERRIDLHQNFRSRASVLESANAVFEQIMQEGLGGIIYDDNAKLVPAAEFGSFEGRVAGKTELILVEQDSDEITLDKKELEASAIGEKIKELVQGENPMYVKEKEYYRPVRYGDIAILLRSLSDWSETMISSLNDMGIPAYADNKAGYFSTLEVETALNYLHIIDNPRQDIPLVSVLHSCFVGLSNEELAWIGAIPEGMDFWDKLQYCAEGADREWDHLSGNTLQNEIDGKTDESSERVSHILEALPAKLTEFLERLDQYRRFAELHSVYELLRKIYHETGYYQYMSAMPAGEKRRANLDILLQQALEFAKNGHQGIHGFSRYIETLKKSKVDYGEASVEGENTNAVRIMSIHKSKGLEFPVVFVAGMGKSFNWQDIRKATIIDTEYGVGSDYVDVESRVKQPTLFKSFISNQAQKKTYAEEIRILYVALTRAKEQLFITGAAKDLKKKLEEWVNHAGQISVFQLERAVTYLDWIVPAICHGGGMQGQIETYFDAENDVKQTDAATEDDDVREDLLVDETEDPQVAFEDELFRIVLQFPEETVEHEKEELVKDFVQYQKLVDWDTTKRYDEGMFQRLTEERLYQYPYGAEEDIPVKISVSELKRQANQKAEQFEEQVEVLLPQGKEYEISDESEIPRPAFLQEEVEISGATRGTLYHMIMEHFPYAELRESGYAWTVTDFDKYLETMIQKGYMTSRERVVVNSHKLVQFISSPIGKRMAEASAAGMLRLEQPFMMGFAANEIYPEKKSDTMVMVQGIIDAFFFQGEDIVLIDYKTDSVRKGQEEELIKKYHAQLEYYATALERLTGRKVVEKVIYSFALGKEIMIP